MIVKIINCLCHQVNVHIQIFSFFGHLNLEACDLLCMFFFENYSLDFIVLYHGGILLLRLTIYKIKNQTNILTTKHYSQWDEQNRIKQNNMLQELSSSQNLRPISLDDLSITSDQDCQSEEEICEGEFFTSSFGREDQKWRAMYPDTFEQYPNILITRLCKFTTPFSHHPASKLLHYQLNCALLTYHISYKLTLIPSHYQINPSTTASFHLLQYYLKLQSITNLCKLLEMVKVIMKKEEINTLWRQQRRVWLTDLRIWNGGNNKGVRISQGDGMNLMKAIDDFTYAIVRMCSHLKYIKHYIPSDLSKIDYEFFDNLPKPLQCRIKLVPKPDSIFLPKIQQHFQDTPLQREFHECNKAYFNKLYKQIHQYYLTNPTDREINQLLYFIIILKIAGNQLPVTLVSYVHKKKVEVLEAMNMANHQRQHQIVTQANLHLRAELSKLHLLIKNRGFMKLLSFVNQAEIPEIQQEIAWCYNAQNNLN